MKKILYNLQLSFIDKNGTFLLNKDSNFSVFYNIAKSMAKYYPDKYQFVVLLPDDQTGAEMLEEIPNVIQIFSDTFTKRVFSSRYHWDADKMGEVIKEFKPDMVWENNPTLVNNWKTLLLEEKMIDKVKVLTYNHWIDTPEMPKIDHRAPYYVRQCEGAVYADKILCNSKEATTQIINCVTDLLPWGFEKAVESIDTLAPYIDDETITIMKRYKNDLYFNIIYNHRLSSLPYYDQPYKLFLQAVEILKTQSMHGPYYYKIHFTDASGKLKSKEDIPIEDSQNVKIILHENLSKINYWNLLMSMDVCVGTFLDGYGGAWSISLAEGILAGCNTIVPNHSGYKEMVPQNYKYLLDQALPGVIASLIYDAAHQPADASGKDFYLKHYSMKALSTKLDSILTDMFTRGY